MNHKIKVILIGESSIGKTAIINRYIYDNYLNNYIQTIAPNYFQKEIKIENKILKLDIWDTAGEERYRAITKIFFNEVQICFLLYDITSKESFKEMKEYWYEQIKLIKECKGKNFILFFLFNFLWKKVIFIVGTKCDLFEKEEVNENEARNFAETINAKFILTSALNNIGINEMFENAAKIFVERTKNDEIINDSENNIFQINNENEKAKNKKKCCSKT